MSLNFQFNKKTYNQISKPELNDYFIWGCMVTDLGKITEQNIEEWFWRYSFAVRLSGAFFYRAKGKPFIPTIEELKERIGLTTNVSTKTRKQFVDKQVSIFRP